MDDGTTTRTSLGFDDGVARTRAALSEQGFGVLTEIDVQATLQSELDQDMEPYLILGACNPHLAHQALEVERDMLSRATSSSAARATTRWCRPATRR